MGVWQGGGHLMSEGGAKVEDWSWARTRRRLATLARLTAPYKVRTVLSIFSLLAATATALAPPFLSKYAVDDGIRRHDLAKLWWIVGAFLLAGLANWGMSYVQTYLTGWVGERILADLRNKLFGHLQRLSLGFYEKNRAGVIISRLTNDVEALDQLVTDGVTSLVQNTLTLVGTAILRFVLGYGGHLYFQGDVTIGTLFAFMLYVQNFFDPIQQLSQLYNTFLSATAALDKIMDVLDKEPEVVDAPDARPLPQLAGGVAFEGVRFAYGRGPEVLHRLDVHVAAGPTVR